ncbi:MAG: PAS domain S-box protein [Oscillatoriales cyanobacterium]|nr:PAS domain S-box protein [Microcoleus sp. PH2017_05_CCC_O_A]MCC3466379.1 PAS domain S-box protein [Microcoleus sp. PH2017_06_SFM_O_A]TAF98016.1 MAG: PAS domain S-box protein [Oscillatoriales cyanobacterium]TAG13629.1 MAG: PAS domain S-box protein [Oscillatoriales cyanobacterium]TAG40158.1 MAG: PAS domain S-box protein [Oscillatoriales cyanobacterium]
MQNFLKIMSFKHNFMPQGGWEEWQLQLMGLHAVSDLLIALAYYSIPAMLIYFARKQRYVPASKGFILLGLGFFCGGTTHLMQVSMLVHPSYALSSLLAAFTAVISVWAVAQLMPSLSQVLAVTRATQLAANTALESQKADRPQAGCTIENPVPSPSSELGPINQQLLLEIAQSEGVQQLLLEIANKLQASEERFRAFQELSLDGFNVFRSIRDGSKIVDFEWEYVNPAAAKIQQSTPEEMVGKRLLQVLPGHQDSGLFDRYVQVVETGIPLNTEISYNSEGIVGWFRIVTVKLGDGMAISFSDITDRKQVEASLRDALQKLTSHFENTPLAVIEWDENFRLSGWSPAAEKIFGWKATEVLGKHFSEWNFIFDGDVKDVQAAIESLKNQHERCNVVRNSNYDKSGSLVHCEWHNSAFYSDSGQLISMLSLVLDVTERFKFMEVLRQSEERFRIAAESASDLIYEWDIETGIVLWFGRVDEILGYEKGRFPRTRAAWNSILNSEDRSQIEAAVDRYLSAPDNWTAPFFQEYRVQCSGGGLLHWIDRGKVVLDKQGHPWKWIGVISDISDRKEAEEQRNQAWAREQTARRAAEASEQLYRILAETIPQIVWTAWPDGWIDYYNQRWFEYTGLTLEKTQGWGWQPVVHPDDLKNSLERWNESVQMGETYEVEYRLKRASDGVYRWHLGRAMPVRDADGNILKWFGTSTDIDDRQRSAQTADLRARALAVLSSASLNYQEALQDLADLAVPGLGDWCCVHLIEADGSIGLQAVAHSDPSKVALLWQINRRLPVDPQGRHGVAKVLRTGESKLYPEIPHWAIEAVLSDNELLEVLCYQNPLSAICVPLIARGRTLGAISLLCGESGRRCGEGDLILLSDLARDAAVAIDNARLYREAAEANRIKDEFLATLSHELRTPLNAVVGWAQILRQRKLSAEKTAVGLETIERNGRLQTQMIEDLLDVSRIVSGKVCLKLRPVDLVPIVETAVKALAPDAEARGVELATFYGEGVSLVRGDATRLQQVVWNLVSNAIKFTPPSGSVEIRLSEEGEPRSAGSAMLSPSPVHSVTIAVSDTGIGISKEFLPFVFDRFRQADSSHTRNYGGLGIGLAIVRHLVELHGGTVWAQSPGLGLGSTFGVRLPIEKR